MNVLFTESAKKSFSKLDKPIKLKIINFIEKKLSPLQKPRSIGKALVGPKKGFWRYRVGDYRLICDIQSHSILILDIGHRRHIYD